LKINTQKRSFRFSLFFLTLVTVFITISSSIHQNRIDGLGENQLPIENSVLLMINSIVDPCPSDDEICDMSEDEIVTQETQASGLAIKTIGDITYILTVAHFCNELFEEMYIPQLNVMTTTELHVIDVEGGIWVAEVVYQDAQTDLCLIQSDMPSVEQIYVSDSDPSLGDSVQAIASPAGIGGRNISLHFGGKFSGCDIHGDCFFTIPSTFGSSGGVILNRENEIVGMIQKKPVAFDSVSISTSRESIALFFKNVHEITKVNLLSH